jgi:hypothetical protein
MQFNGFGDLPGVSVVWMYLVWSGSSVDSVLKLKLRNVHFSIYNMKWRVPEDKIILK